MNVEPLDNIEPPPLPADSRNRAVSWITRAVVALLVLAIGAAVAGALLITAPRPSEVQQATTLQQVKVFEAKQVPIRRQWRGYGVAAAIDRSDVPARVAATVISIPATIQAGRPIKQNDLIAQLDDTDFKHQEEQAAQRINELDALLTQIEIEGRRYEERLKIEAEDVRLAQNEVDRVTNLFKGNAAKQNEVDVAKRMLISAQRAELSTRELIDKIVPRKTAWQALKAGQIAAQRIAAQNSERCRIASPIDGVLQAVDVKPGESLQPGQRVARVVSLARVEVPVQLPVAARADTVIGGVVRLEATNETGICWDAKVVRLSPEDDPTTRTMTAYVEVDQKSAAGEFGSAGASGLLTPGMFVAALASSDVEEPRWVVPRRSIRAGRLLLVKDGAIVTRETRIDHLSEGPLPQLGVPDDQWAVLTHEPAPLMPGELIVLNASVSVRDGDKVEPVIARQEATTAQPSAPVKSTAEKDRDKRATP